MWTWPLRRVSQLHLRVLLRIISSRYYGSSPCTNWSIHFCILFFLFKLLGFLLTKELQREQRLLLVLTL